MPHHHPTIIWFQKQKQNKKLSYFLEPYDVSKWLNAKNLAKAKVTVV